MGKYDGIEERKNRAGYEAWHVSGKDPATGRRIRKHFVGPTKEAVRVKRKQYLDDLEDGMSTDPAIRGLTLGAYMRLWLAAQQTRGLEQKTLTDYAYAVDRLDPLIGDARMDVVPKELTKRIEVAAGHLRLRGNTRGTVRRALQERDYDTLTADEAALLHMSGASVNGFLRVLSIICNEAVHEGVLRINPVLKVRRPSAKPTRPKVALNNTQVRRLVEALDGVDRLRFVVAVHLGLRQGEVLALHWSKFDLEEGTVTIDAAVERRTWKHGCADPDGCGHQFKPSYRAAKCSARHGGGLVFKSTKEDDSTPVPLSPPLVDLLRAHRLDQRKTRLAASEEWHDHNLVFCQPNGKPIDPRRDTERWNRMLADHDLPGSGTHLAKHTAVTLAYRAGADRTLVSEVLARHASGSAFTERNYRHINGAEERALADTMSSIVFG